MNKVILAGGSGYLGNVLKDFYKDKAKEVIILTRGLQAQSGNVRWLNWDGRSLSGWENVLEDADLLVNLAGKNVNCRYTEENKREIVNSRVESTKVLGEALIQLKNPPKVWIQCVSATIYRDSRDIDMDEETGEIGEGFSVNVCQQWEQAFKEQNISGVRKVALRISFVLGRNGGAFPTLLRLVKFGLGGKQGDGGQYVSWIHENDFARIINWTYLNEKAEGVYNCTAPTPVVNAFMMDQIRKFAEIPLGLPSSECLLSIGAKIIGTEKELVLKSRKVVPTRLTKEGFQFGFERMELAVQDLIRSHSTQNI